jgi:hypothetical protein
MMKRNELIIKARELIASQPDAGRRKIASELRREYGTGLRDAVILSLQREAYPERRRIIVEPYQLAKPLEARYRPLRQSRYNKLVKMNFSNDEAHKFSNLPLTRLPFIKDAAKARKIIISSVNKQGKFQGLSKTQLDKQLREVIDFEYKENGWTDADDNNNPYSMLRAFRQAAIKSGAWDPKDSPWRKKPSVRQKMFSSRWKGNTTAQKRTYRSLHKDSIREQKADYRRRQREKRAAAK